MSLTVGKILAYNKRKLMIINRIPSFAGRMSCFDTKWSSLTNGIFSFGEISLATNDRKPSERMNRDVF